MAGYSSKNLADKLGIKSGMRVIVLREPAEYSTQLSGRYDLIHYFASSEEQVEAALPELTAHLATDGMLWLSWAKRTSQLHTGLDENAVRRLGLAAGLVDVKVAAVDDDWSGLKFVYRLKDRK